MWRKFIAFFTGHEVVWLCDFDGYICCRLVRDTPFGKVGWRMSRFFAIGPITCMPDGTVKGTSYCTHWKPAN